MLSTLVQESNITNRIVAIVADNAANRQKAFSVEEAEAEEIDDELDLPHKCQMGRSPG